MEEFEDGGTSTGYSFPAIAVAHHHVPFCEVGLSGNRFFAGSAEDLGEERMVNCGLLWMGSFNMA